VTFSKQIIDAIKAEANALGLRGATSITVALREQLAEDRKGVGDGRTVPYWVCGQVVNKGIATPLPGILQVQGMKELSGLAVSAAQFIGVTPPEADCADASIGGLRVGLTRSGAGHLTVLLPHSRRPPDMPDAWVDLFIYKNKADAESKAKTFRAGKIF
jgi:hypothetical protein